MAKGWKLPLERRYLRLINKGMDDPRLLARKLEMGLEEFVEWAAQSRIRALERSLRRIRELGAQMTLAEQKRHAVQMLVKMISSEEQTDRVRRACVDLLKGAFAPAGPAGDTEPPGAFDSPDRGRGRQLLEEATERVVRKYGRRDAGR